MQAQVFQGKTSSVPVNALQMSLVQAAQSAPMLANDRVTELDHANRSQLNTTPQCCCARRPSAFDRSVLHVRNSQPISNQRCDPACRSTARAWLRMFISPKLPS